MLLRMLAVGAFPLLWLVCDMLSWRKVRKAQRAFPLGAREKRCGPRTLNSASLERHLRDGR